MANAALHPYLDWSGPIAFAHRGGASDNPENTMPAFQRAVELGYTYLETDVHATSDGVLVAFHDPDLSRTCDRPGTISELTWAEVSQARVRGEEPIPLFDDLLEAFPDARFNIDCKADSALDGLTAALKRHDCLDRICVGGFSDKRIRRLRREFGSSLCSSLGPLQIASLRFFGPVPWGGQVAQIPISVKWLTVTRPATIRRAHQRGLQVHVWTIDDPTEMHRLLDMGVDGIMTDRLRVLKDVLIERGEWH